MTIDGEKKALITYMRTDSTRVSKEAISSVRKFLKEKLGLDYIPAKANEYVGKKNAQDAHEAIRPIDVNITEELLL